ncbi:hypothetical protein K443DRAFT_514802 [Laccaria amethystina LaAM-08-1]|uniref:Uncharacterized protein n=1 Tax=Laccaria amethystina LaAM-08-1 TaxID=1095629 RepID=A0A0C9X010_9AGAR|nr:hypothetical protein K443DRAFT_514802 [Laccaria amethystina LaAM-08-1]
MRRDSASPRHALRRTRYHGWDILRQRNAGVGVGSHTQGYEECKAGTCDVKEDGWCGHSRSRGFKLIRFCGSVCVMLPHHSPDPIHPRRLLSAFSAML